MVFFRHVFFKKPPDLKERYIKGKRHYESPTGSLLPSVTTVLSLLSDTGIKAWRKRVGEVEADKVMDYIYFSIDFIEKYVLEFSMKDSSRATMAYVQ